MSFKSWVRGVVNSMFGVSTIEQALSIRVAVEPQLERDRALWRAMLDGNAPWVNNEVPSLKLEKSICREVANNTCFELDINATGDKPFTDFFDMVKGDIGGVTSELCGLGVVIAKPYVRNGKVLCTYATPDKFYPLSYNEVGQLTSVAFADYKVDGDTYFTLLETHTWEEQSQVYTIAYKAYTSKVATELGREISIERVKDWAGLQDIEWLNIPQPLFVEFSLKDNQSIFADAVEFIKQADRQYGRTVWEYEGGELAIDASIELFKSNKKGEEPQLPKGKKRLYRNLNVASEKFAMETFNPTFRDESLFRGLNEHKRAIEFACGLAYGTISDISVQEKTATEVMAAKQRYYITVSAIQRILDAGYKKLAISINILISLYKLTNKAKNDIIIVWGDSIKEDFSVEYARRLQLVATGIISPAEFRAWYLGEDIDEATKNLPKPPQSQPIVTQTAEHMNN